MRTMPLTIGTLHFIGIGGIGMSGIAEILHQLGYAVQGSDVSDSPNVKRLQEKGIPVTIGQHEDNLTDKNGEDVSVVVVSSAIKPDNPELQAARALKLPIVKRAEMLAELMRLKWGIAIGGTHGKTTTTSLVGAMLEEGGYDPTVVNGGIVNRYGTNTRLGQGDWMVVEADESDGSLTRFPSTIAVITNIDPEHMDHYNSFDDLKKTFHRFVDDIPFYGFAVLCIDHPEVRNLSSQFPDKRIVTYGFADDAAVRAHNIRHSPNGNTFDVTFAHDNHTITDIFLSMPGEHNAQNALAAIAIAREMGMSDSIIKKALSEFTGVKRRFTKTGEVNGITIIDDYGHHPVEITAVLKTGRQVLQGTEGRIIAVVQPHRYTRLADLYDDFCQCFKEADTVIVADVYAAGEQPLPGIDKDHLVEGIRKTGLNTVYPLPHKDNLADLVAEHTQPGDLVICLGAGDITKWAQDLPTRLSHFSFPKKQSA